MLFDNAKAPDDCDDEDEDTRYDEYVCCSSVCARHQQAQVGLLGDHRPYAHSEYGKSCKLKESNIMNDIKCATV